MSLCQEPKKALNHHPMHFQKVRDINKYYYIEDPSLIFGRKPKKVLPVSPKGLSVIKFPN